jgi:hypothetical protein
MKPPISSLAFFKRLKWIDGTPLKIEPYRQDLFRKALDTYRDDGVPQYSMVLAGRGKKNNKSLDLILAALFVLVCRNSPQGSDALIVANDEDQANQDLDLAKKLIAANPDLADELLVFKDEIRRKDGGGTMRVLPANNVIGQHGKTCAFLGYDEVHGQRDHSLFEALAPDPTRYTLVWVTSYDSLFDEEGAPLHDFKKIGCEGSDPRMLYSWYSGDYCTDPAFANLPPEERANPSMSSWPEGRGYLDQQRRRLPYSKYRRLHLNLPGAPQGAFFDQGIVEKAIIVRRTEIPPQDGVDYLAFCDMSGGSSDDATLGIAHWDGTKAVLDLLINQVTAPPFNPRIDGVARFATACRRYHCKTVNGDSYAGMTFRHDFAECGIDYIVCKQTRTDLYENLEVALNAGQVELLDLPKLRSEMMTIIRKGTSLNHMAGRHDDWATSAAGALTLVNPDIGKETPHILEWYRRQSEAVTATASTPTLRQEHGAEAVMQLGNRRPADFVCVNVISDTSHIFGISGTPYATEIVNGKRVCWMSVDDAKQMVGNPYAHPALREANADLLARVGNVKPKPAGIRVVDMLQAFDDARPRSPFDKGGMLNDVLRAAGRLPR